MSLQSESFVVKPSGSVRDLGMQFDSELTMRIYISKTAVVVHLAANGTSPTYNKDLATPMRKSHGR